MGTTINGIMAVDLDGDGLPEILGAHVSSGGVLISRNRTHPYMGADCNHNGTPDACDLASGLSHDVDGDGIPDEPAVGSTVSALAVADLDGDGRLDIVGASKSSRTIHVLRQAGPRSFLPMVPLAAGCTCIDVADVNADGRPDLVALDLGTAGLSVFLGAGGGAFQPLIGIPLAVPTPWAFAVKDLTGDGFPDILIACYRDDPPGFMVLFKGTGDGTFRKSGMLKLDLPIESFDLADLDGDGILDLACRFSNRVTIQRGSGNGIFGSPVVYPIAPYTTDLRCADFDGDGSIDLAITNRLGLSVLLNRGDGIFGAELRYLGGADSTSFIRVGRLDGGSESDLVLGIVQSRIRVLLNLSGPRQSPDCNGNGVPDGCDLSSGTSRDADGDGHPDECQPDCDGDGVPDAYEIAIGSARDVDGNGVPDTCQPDCNGDGLPDGYELATGKAADCNLNGIPDSCDIASGAARDVDGDGVPDSCQPDCDGDSLPDAYELATGKAVDCDRNGIPDPCDIASGAARDCNGNGIPDSCEIADGNAQDADRDGIPDRCELTSCQIPGNCNQDDVLNIVDAICLFNFLFKGSPARLPCGDGSPAHEANLAILDWQPDGRVDLSDGIKILLFLFLGGPPHPLAVPGSERTGCIDIYGCPRKDAAH